MNFEKLNNYTTNKEEICRKNDSIAPELYKEHAVNKGLRDMNGNGVVKLTFGNSITDDLIVGHMYRLSWENTNQVMTDQIGLPYTDCVMDFVFSENCDAPTALQACPV